jgi:hypothetical protein
VLSRYPKPSTFLRARSPASLCRSCGRYGCDASLRADCAGMLLSRTRHPWCMMRSSKSMMSHVRCRAIPGLPHKVTKSPAFCRDRGSRRAIRACREGASCASHDRDHEGRADETTTLEKNRLQVRARIITISAQVKSRQMLSICHCGWQRAIVRPFPVASK